MLCLNLGSFVDVIPGEHWWNLDILPLQDRIPPNVNFKQWDLRYGLPYDNDSVDVIRASHVFEHLLIEEQRNLAECCYAVLKPGGVLRVSVPDGVDILYHFFNSGLGVFDSIQPPEFVNATTDFEKLSRLLYSGDGAHHCLHDKEFLIDILSSGGFVHPLEVMPNKSASDILQNETKDQHIEISLIVEGVK